MVSSFLKPSFSQQIILEDLTHWALIVTAIHDYTDASIYEGVKDFNKYFIGIFIMIWMIFKKMLKLNVDL